MSDQLIQDAAPVPVRKKPAPVRKNKTKKRIVLWSSIVIGLIVVGVLGVYLAGGFQTQSAAAQNNGEDYYTASVTRGDLRIAVTGTGTLTAAQSADLSFSAAGTVSELNVQAGDMVTKGQVLARVDNQKSLEADVAAAELSLLEARQTLDNLQKNAGLALAQSYQDLLSAQSAYEDAQFNLERTAYARCSQEKNTQLAQKVDTAETKLKNLSISKTGSEEWITAKSEYDTAVANYAYCLNYTAAEATSYKAELTVAENDLARAQEKYDILVENTGVDPDELALAQAQVTKAQSDLDAANEALEGVTLIAPLDGKVVYLGGSLGSTAGTSTFITVADISRPTLNLTVDETDLDQLVIGYKVEAVFDALSDAVYEGQIIQADPQLSSFGEFGGATGKAELNESAAKALANVPLGLSATVEIISVEADNAILAPVEALRDLGDGGYAVFVRGADGQLTLRAVEVGIVGDTYAEIKSGLQEGETVSTGILQAGN